MVTHACDAYLFLGFNYDKVMQASAGQAWLDQLGYSVASVNSVGAVVRAPVVHWPPGYSLAYAMLLRVLVDPLRATYAIDVVAAIVFLVSWWRIFRAMRSSIDQRAEVVFWTYWALVCSPIFRLPSSDLASVAFFSAAIAVGLATSREAVGVWRGLLGGTLAGVASAVRFAYWPLAWIPLVPVMIEHRRHAWRHATAYAVAAIVPIAWAIVNVGSAGPADHVSSEMVRSTLHWHQLSQWPPFGATLLGIDAALLRLAVSVPPLRILLQPAFWAVTAIVLVFGGQAAWRAIRSPEAPVRAFAVCGGLTAAVTFALLAALTVRVPAFDDGWTYATSAARYFVPTYPFLFLALAEATLRSQRTMALILATLLAASGLTVAAYRSGELVMYFRKNANAHMSGSQARREFHAVFETVRQARAVGEVLYCDTNFVRQAAAIIAGAAAPRRCDAQMIGRATAASVVTVDVTADGRPRFRTIERRSFPKP
ncbi:MAG: hypothetical protein HY048_17360 [Acidobacteria bacterium]|nr:hypothetical protein [Acidobacteriota bacterium]